MAERFIHIGTVSHFVQDRLGVSPKPRNWPEQPAKAKREQTQALNRSRLWMFFLMGNFFRQNMNEPESGDAKNRRNDEHDPRDAIGDRVKRLAVKKRGVGLSWQRQDGKRDQRSEPPAVTAPRLRRGLVYYIIRFTLHFLVPLYKMPIPICRDPEARSSFPIPAFQDEQFGWNHPGLAIGL